MSISPSLILRPVASSTPATAYRVNLSSRDLESLNLRPGEICQLAASGGGITGEAIVARSTDPKAKGFALISHVLQALFGFTFGEPITIQARSDLLPVAESIEIVENSPTSNAEAHNLENEGLWLSALYTLPIIALGLSFDLPASQSRRTLNIQKINGSATAAGSAARLHRLTFRTKVKLATTPQSEEKIQLNYDGAVGLKEPIETINRRLISFLDPSRALCQSLARDRHPEILLFGPRGTGKSFLLQKLREAPWKFATNIDSSISRNEIERAFDNAKLHEPSLVTIDNLQRFGSSGGSNSVVASLTRCLESLETRKVFVIGATNDLDAIDEELLGGGRFLTRLELNIPTQQGRIAILQSLNGDYPVLDPKLFKDIATETKGYSSNDLLRLMDKALEQLSLRQEIAAYAVVSQGAEKHSGKQDALDKSDFTEALKYIRPSALGEILPDIPTTRWSDIGGSNQVVEALQEVIDWPINRAHAMAVFDVRPQRGMLLFGPPGCSKTLTAKAMACESRRNFLSVKGAELISKYVGDSERALRKIFDRARAAAPSIIFFDEIDAIAASREDSHAFSGLNVLTTLLTLMDGIESQKDVFVLAATNKPDLLDAALLRPGRFDSLVYVGPPDAEARRQIFEIRTAKMRLREDVDLARLAQLSEGHSGAEVVRICEKAAWAELRNTSVDTPNKSLAVGMERFLEAIETTPKQITKEMCLYYEEWASQGLNVGKR